MINFTLVAAVQVFASLFLLYRLFKSVFACRSPETRPIVVANGVLFLSVGIPLALSPVEDISAHRWVFSGYSRYAGGDMVSLFCALQVCIAPIIWTSVALKPAQGRVVLPSGERRLLRFLASKSYVSWALWVGAVLPCVMVWFAPDPTVYIEYGPLLPKVGRNAVAELTFHTYLLVAIIYSTLACFCLFYLAYFQRWKYRFLTFVVLICLIAIDCYLHGKRSAVAVSLFGIVLSLWYCRAIGWKGLVVISASIVALVPLLSLEYQKTMKRTTVDNLSDFFVETRIDFFRDLQLKLAFATTGIGPQKTEILDFYGESVFIYATVPIPRAYWRDKPVSYGMSMACAAMGIPRQYIGWGLTTSILDECVTNFHLLGMFIGPWIVGLLLRQSVAKRDELFALLTSVTVALMLMVHLSACMPVLLLWFAATVVMRRK